MRVNIIILTRSHLRRRPPTLLHTSRQDASTHCLCGLPVDPSLPPPFTDTDLFSNRRRKCEVTQPGQACAYCKSRNVQCSFAVTNTTSNIKNTASSWHGPSPTSNDGDGLDLALWPSTSAPSNGIPPQDVCEELVRLYFQYIHDTFHSLFHAPSLMEDVRNGVIPRVILLSIISLSSRFSTDLYFAGIDPRVRGRQYAREAERLLDLRDISVTTIQACVLLGAFVITEGEALPESLYYSVACRLAMAIDLPNSPVSTRLEQETNIRIWWSLCMIDVWSSNGVRLPRSIVPRDDVPFPMEEVVFLEMRRENFDLPSPTMMQESAASLLTQMVKLNAILVEVGELNRAAAANQSFSFELYASVDSLTKKLDDWYANLPEQLKDTPENLRHYADLGLGYFFVAVYLGYYHYGQLLYYQYLHEDSYDEVSHAGYYAAKCKAHSTALCEILYRAYTHPGCEVYYTMVGHVLVIASTVQLHILLFSLDDSQVKLARSRLERNFEILTRLQTFWPTLDVCFTRFREFHKACQKSKESSFRLDRWMLQFLFEFAKPVGEKTDELAELHPWSMTDLGFSPYTL
ncbi:hypothetical protein H2198_009313 [Neophaeococcomyces mojaviensis]|uniref:Uncharacterized protein n=1 Tax=Neophaeococcomyces mojaviensis TaxID=3383035 RepID=A0ACC2ZUR9_9EURO|nr:hypothetical protein H2198_009313 [Knufia sp. JES_112]